MANHVAERQTRSEQVDPVAERMRRLAEQMFAQLGSPALLAEIPGVQRNDVNIELVGNELMITGELKEKERTGVVRRRTRRVGRFDYRVMLPSQVDSNGIEAKLSDGVLTVRVPKMKQDRRKIEVKAS
jgi:HSP20 family molecular chaperone IbpA